MFAPNRLITTKEQWLLVGLAAAVLIGSITVLVHNRWPVVSEDARGTVTIEQKVHAAATEKASIQAEQGKVETLVEHHAVETVIPKEDVAPESKVVGVAIMGAVHDPDLYMMAAEARVTDLIAAAGGVTDKADMSDILLTAPLVDETTLTIPELPTVTMDETRIVVRRSNGSAVTNPPWYRRSMYSLYSRQTVPGTTSLTEASANSGVASNTSAVATSGLLNINQASSEQLQQLPGIGPVFAERIIKERANQPFMTVEELTRVSGIAEKRLEAIRPFITAP